jgi:hypothetical protein
MSEERSGSYVPVLIGGLAGFVIGLGFLVICFFLVFGICSDTSLAEMLFPYSLATDPTLDDKALPALILALIQYPLYGVALGFVWAKDRIGKLWVLACVLMLLVAHGAVVGFAKHRVHAMRFSHMKQHLQSEPQPNNGMHPTADTLALKFN